MDYYGLQQELQTWLADVNYDLALVLPNIIEGAEAEMNRRLRTLETECRTSADLTPDGVTEDQLGVYAVPLDWNGHKSIERSGDLLKILYFQLIPALSDTTLTNWVLDKHQDLYRYSCLVAAGVFLGQERPGLAERVELIYEQIEASDQNNRFGGGPLRTRVSSERPWRFTRPATDGRLEFLPPYDFFDLEDSDIPVQEAVPGYFTLYDNLIRIYPKPALPTP